MFKSFYLISGKLKYLILISLQENADQTLDFPISIKIERFQCREDRNLQNMWFNEGNPSHTSILFASCFMFKRIDIVNCPCKVETLFITLGYFDTSCFITQL